MARDWANLPPWRVALPCRSWFIKTTLRFTATRPSIKAGLVVATSVQD
jgi:hypothetical protein